MGGESSSAIRIEPSSSAGNRLVGADISSPDIRQVALLLAALCARAKHHHNIHQIDRGYERIGGAH